MDVSPPQDEARHRAYVGRAAHYDFLGAAQFRLLTTLGLRARHSLLDFGCGSLRAGRLFIPYLDEGRYFGVEPNRWLVDDGIAREVGADLIALKRPRFDFNGEFRVDGFGRRFDFILAQSIFSHSGADLIAVALRRFREALEPDGLVAATFAEGVEDSMDSGWVYPGAVRHRPATIERLIALAGLPAVRIPWYHPGQAWYLLAHDGRRLPDRAMRRHLRGAVLYDPEFECSWRLHDGPDPASGSPPAPTG
jgi:SAM-dependent methyltransferase